MQYLRGRVALVTGSTSGIGLVVAHRLAKAGMQIVLNGLASPDEAQKLCDLFQDQYGQRTDFQPCDLRDYRQIEQMMKDLSTRYGAVDVLVNNAGIQHVSPITEFSPNIWNDMLAVNLSASFHTIRTALPDMKRRDWGRIINMASVSGLRGRSGKAGYNATKHGLIGLTKSIAIEMASTPITCNALCPGWVHTPLVQKQVDNLARQEGLDNDEATRRLISLRQPSGRFVTKEQVAETVFFLCTDAASEVRGVSWEIDGGTTAQ